MTTVSPGATPFWITVLGPTIRPVSTTRGFDRLVLLDDIDERALLSVLHGFGRNDGRVLDRVERQDDIHELTRPKQRRRGCRKLPLSLIPPVPVSTVLSTTERYPVIVRSGASCGVTLYWRAAAVPLRCRMTRDAAPER